MSSRAELRCLLLLGFLSGTAGCMVTGAAREALAPSAEHDLDAIEEVHAWRNGDNEVEVSLRLRTWKQRSYCVTGSRRGLEWTPDVVVPPSGKGVAPVVVTDRTGMHPVDVEGMPRSLVFLREAPRDAIAIAVAPGNSKGDSSIVVYASTDYLWGRSFAEYGPPVPAQNWAALIALLPVVLCVDLITAPVQMVILLAQLGL